MTTLNKLLYKLTGGLPCRVICLGDVPYLERYYVGKVFGVTIYLHRFVSSDSERHVHNHPWRRGLSLILAGSYVEERATDMSNISRSGCLTTMTRRRWFNRVDGNTFHRIHRAEPGTWSLFMHGPRQQINGDLYGLGPKIDKGWGFFDNGQFTPHTSSPPDWHLTAHHGRHVPGRAPLRRPHPLVAKMPEYLRPSRVSSNGRGRPVREFGRKLSAGYGTTAEEFAAGARRLAKAGRGKA